MIKNKIPIISIYRVLTIYPLSFLIPFSHDPGAILIMAKNPGESLIKRHIIVLPLIHPSISRVSDVGIIFSCRKVWLKCKRISQLFGNPPQGASKTGLSLTIPTQQNNQEDDDADPDRNGGVHYRKHPRPFSAYSNHPDTNTSKSPGPYAPRLWNYNRMSSYQPSISQSHSDMDHLIPPPTCERDKSKMTR